MGWAGSGAGGGGVSGIGAGGGASGAGGVDWASNGTGKAMIAAEAASFMRRESILIFYSIRGGQIPGRRCGAPRSKREMPPEVPESRSLQLARRPTETARPSAG